MPFLDYNRDIPDGPNNPSDDQPLMKINNNSIDTLIAVDHAGFKNNDGGYHTVIHQVRQSVDPAAVAGYNEIYTKYYTPDYTGSLADTQLFNRTGLGGVSQLTGNASGAQPTLGQTEGWQWVGNFLIQTGWVLLPAANATGTVTFKDRFGLPMIPFPTNCFSVTTSITSLGVVVAGSPLLTISFQPTNLSFDWAYQKNGAVNISGFFWTAIGN